jgi:NADH-quinone oxidoreductase subunit J
MYITTIVLIILSVLAIASAIVTIIHKEPIKSALTLVFHFFMLAGIYLTLSAQFLAIMQVIVYAGAIMVLVLFVIMLLNAGDEDEAQKRKKKVKQYFAVTAGVGMLVLILCFIICVNSKIEVINSDTMSSSLVLQNGTVESIGKELYTKFLVPLEIVGIMLLSAIIGAVMLSKKHIS